MTKYRQHAWMWMYSTRVWKQRRKQQRVKQPLCEECLRHGHVREARVAHHVVPHKGNWDLFCTGDLESLCKQCHDAHTASTERAGLPVRPRTGLDGWPIT